MQVFTQNSDTRALPDGWVEHFDSQRKLWYYVDLDSDPPKLTLVHPLDKGSPSSAPAKFREHGTRTPPSQRPIGPRENAASPSGCVVRPSQRPRRATVAQQLYASSLPTKPRPILTTHTISESNSTSSSRHPSGSNTPESDGFASGSSSSAASPSSNSNEFGNSVSPTSPTSTPHLDAHSPRNILDCTRLSGTRRVTYSGPQPRVTRTALAPAKANTIGTTRSDATTVNPQSFYHPSVQTTPSPIPPQLPKLVLPDNEARTSAVSTPATQKIKTINASNEISNTTSNSGTIFSPSGSTSTVMPPIAIKSASRNKKPYTALLTDDLIIPSVPANSSSSHSLPPLDVSNIHDGTANVRPLPSISSHTNRNNISPLTNQAIVQPKPIRPMAGVTLNLQVQVADMTPESLEQNGEEIITKKKKNALLKTFGLNLSKNAKGKRPIRTIEDAENLESSPMQDGFCSRMKQSLVLIESPEVS